MACLRQKELDTEVERMNAKIRLLQAQRDSHKRKAEPPSLTERDIAVSWRNMRSLSAAIWQARPAEHADDMAEALRRIERWARQDGHLRGIRHQLRALPRWSDVVVVYCDIQANHELLVQAYWQPVVAAPPESVSHGAQDLVQAVLGTMGMEIDRRVMSQCLAGGNAVTVKRLDDGFVRPTMSDWPLLWAKRSPKQPLVIPTYIDVAQDPIIARLREWMSSPENRPAPEFPVTGGVDQRPREPVPDTLQAIDPDVWPIMQRAGLGRVLARHRDAYDRSQSLRVAAAETPHDERLRQYRRMVAAGGEELSCRQINDLFGWGCANDTTLLKAITEVLMRDPDRVGGPVATTPLWYGTTKGSVALWRHRMCLLEMRRAIILVTRLRCGGADVTFLARDVSRQLIPW